MKRRLPTIRIGRDCVGRDQPPAAHRRREPPPAQRQPIPAGRRAAPNAAPIAANANRPASADGRTASPPSSTASAANATPSSGARAPNRRTQPRAVVYGTPSPRRRRPHPAPPAGHLRDHRADRLGRIQPPGQHERRQQRMTHPARPAPQPRHEDLPAPARRPDMTPVPRPQHHRPARTTGNPDAGTPPHGPPPRRHRPAAGTAIPWPRATHRLGSLPATVRQTRRGGIPHVSNGDGKILARPRAARQQHHQRTRPRHPPRMLRKSGRQHRGAPAGWRGSGSQAAGSGWCGWSANRAG